MPYEIDSVTGERKWVEGNPDPHSPCPHCGNTGPIEAEVLGKLDSMTKEQLLNLIRCVSGAIWGYALTGDAEKAEAARLKLYNLGMSASEVHKAIPALDKWFDRTEGKAPQSIAMTLKADPVSKLTDDQLAALLAQLPDPLIIPPMPKRQD